MPKYNVPSEPEYNVPSELEYSEAVNAAPNKRKKQRQPTVMVHMDPAWLATLTIDTKITVELSGTVKGIRSSTEKYGGKAEEDHSIRLAVDTVEYYGKDEKEVDDVMNGGEED